MDSQKDFEWLLSENRIEKCALCHNKMKYIGGGKYSCVYCGCEALDDFGKIKQFLDENGPATAAMISRETGVEIKVIDMYLKKGRVEIPDGSRYYLSCESCGCNIKCGRYCPDCIRKTANDIRDIFYEDMGDKPKLELNPEMAGKMRYFNQK